MRKLRLLLVPVVLAIMLVIIPAALVLAIADPDSPPQVNAVYIFEFDDGTVGVLADYYLDYAALPAETVTEAYLVIFIDTDGTTQLKSVAPYTFVDSGYGRGLAWIRFTAAEVASYGLDSALSAGYDIWLVGNPTLAWAGDPPKTTAGIDQWNTTGDMGVQLAVRVLYYADQLELIWSLDLVESTPLGNRLTTLGESYFVNVIPNLRTLAPLAFSSGEVDPDYTPISYDTAFGATAMSETAIVVGSPQTLVSGTNTVDTGATTGTIILDLAGWTFGTITDNTGTVTGSPAELNPGVNTLTVTGAGTFTVEVEVINTITRLEDATTGTAFDLTGVATAFGLSRWMFSGILWVIVSVVICAAVYRAESKDGGLDIGGSKVVTLVFTASVIGGTLLGLLHPLVSALLFVATGALIGYVFFFKSDALHKGFMFMVWMFIIVSVAGNVVAGSTALVATRLTANLAAGTVNSIPVASTTGFPDAGIIVIGDEKIGYPSKTATTFERSAIAGVTTNPILRGVSGTEDVAHSENDMVRTQEAGMLNASMDYKIARIVDTAGVVDFITLPVKLLDLVLSFFILPLDFLGTDLAVLSYIWIIVAVGMIVGFITALVGGRRV